MSMPQFLVLDDGRAHLKAYLNGYESPLCGDQRVGVTNRVGPGQATALCRTKLNLIRHSVFRHAIVGPELLFQFYLWHGSVCCWTRIIRPPK